MHPVRRRKKRPNYGVRTVEVARGKNGFGFTISGQQPCILSCIVSGSPAEKAGLRPGDYLVAVNGQSVSKLLHDDVVRLIGCLNGVLKLQIAENYYSDSSDEDHIVSVRSKPKFVHKPRNVNVNHRTNGTQPSRASKAVRDYKSSSGHDKLLSEGASRPVFNDSWELPTLPLRGSNSHHPVDSKEELCFVIGYLGTIEMPKQILPGCRPQVVRGCIKRLRAEKRSHSWVLMRVHADGVTVAGSGGKILAEYPVNRIIFCGPSSEEDKKYFGLVTTATGVGNDVSPSSSCHVFAVQSNLFEHQKHSAEANSFKITCTSGTLTQGCFEFPPTSEPILNAIKSFCLTKDEGNRQFFNNEMLLANSPQPSHSGSTAASSNSDSGIGFRDDCGNQSDRIVMVDIENQRLHIQQLCNNTKSSRHSPNTLNIQLQPSEGNLETPSANLQHAFACVSALCPFPVALDPLRGSCSSGRRLTARAIPDSKVPTSNRSRSPLNSSSSSSEDDKTLMKHGHLKTGMSRNKTDRSDINYSKIFANEDLSKSLPVSGMWYEKSIFYQLGLMPDGSGRPKGIHDLSYKATSKSSENLDQSNYYAPKTGSDSSNMVSGKANSKSIDNLMQLSSNDFLIKNFKLSPQVNNVSKCNATLMGQKVASPLSISYGEGSIIHGTRGLKHSVSKEEISCDKTGGVLLSYSMSPNLNFSKDFLGGSKSNVKCGLKQSQFKSADDMSICSSKSNDAFLSYKLSPKVYGIKRPLATHSLEDLKDCNILRDRECPSANSSRIQQWGSLQDLRSFSPPSFEATLQKNTNNGFGEKETSENDQSRNGVVAWSTSFEKLLEDPAGLNAFAEFLKKEFSQENIVFWIACEKYKSLDDESQRKKLASEIFETHLGMGATEPVNVDAHAHQYTQEKLSEAPLHLFVPAQKQIFNLMKFDSYPRFIKSELYKECLLRELKNEELPYSGNLELPPGLQQGEGDGTPNRGKLKKSRSDAEDCRRKSLLPWHRKNRSKSKDRGESEYKLSTMKQKNENEDEVSVRSEITSSRSSLASWDLALRGSFSRQSITSGETSERENCQLCRVILPDGATTVVQVRQKETVRELIHRLLEKRGLHFSSFELYVAGSPKPLLLDEDACTLSNKEVRIEQRIVFRLDLPNRRTVSVKAKATKTLGQVLRSVLNKYSYKLEAVTICSMSDNEVLELNLQVTAVDGRRLTVLTRSTDSAKGENVQCQGTNAVPSKTFVKVAPTLDEITNKVFEELLQGKSEGIGKSDQGSVKSEEWGSEHSSGIFGKFLRRDSAFHEKSRTKSRGGNRPIFEGATKHVEGMVSLVTGKPPIIGKWKNGGKISGKSDSDELYEGLKRAQRSRLEDQRGTEINFELPDFLKDKENAPQNGKKLRKFRREDGASTPKFCDSESTTADSQQISTLGLKNSPRTEKTASPVQHAESTTKPDLSTTSVKKQDCAGRTMSKLLTCKTYETPKTTPIKSDMLVNEHSGSEGKNKSSNDKSTPGPPPLPPKPKYLPPKTNLWSQCNYVNNKASQEITNRGNNFPKPSDIKRDSKLVRSRRAVYLDQPSSSFV